jgi:hypothetical protein
MISISFMVSLFTLSCFWLKINQKGSCNMDLTLLLIGGIPIILIVFGLVEFIKIFGLKGKWLTLVSLLLGLLFGILYKLAIDPIPHTFGGWFEIIVLGLAIGLTTSGVYDFLNVRFPKKNDSAINILRK